MRGRGVVALLTIGLLPFAPPAAGEEEGAGDEAGAEEVLRAWVLLVRGQKLVEAGKPGDAVERMEEAVAILRRQLGEHADTAYGLHELGLALARWARPGDASPLVEEALAMRRRLFEGDHPDVAASLDLLATIRMDMGRLAEALLLHQEAVAMHMRLYPGDHEHVARGLHNVATALCRLGRPAEAVPSYEGSLAMCRRLYPGDHNHVATSLQSLALAHDALGCPADALPLKGESLAMWRRLFPGDRPEVAQGLTGLASTLRALGRPADALPLEEESLAMRRRIYPDDHPDVAQGLNNLAATLGALGRPADALPLKEESLAMWRRLFPGDHPEVARLISNLAFTLGALGRHADALALQEESLAMRRRLLPPDHPDVATDLGNVAASLVATGRPEDAVQLLEESLDMCRRLFPGDHPQVALSLNNLAAAVEVTGRLAEALPLRQESLEMCRRLFPGDHPNVARTLNNLAVLLGALGRSADALSLQREAAGMAERLGWSESHTVLVRFGEGLLAAGRMTEGAAVLLRAVEHVERLRSAARGLGAQERALYVEELRRWDPYAPMVRAQVALGRPEEALAFLERGRGRELRDLLEQGRGDPLAEAETRARARADQRALAVLAEARRRVQESEAKVLSTEQEEAAARREGLLKGILAAGEAASAARRALLDAGAAETRLLRDVLPETRSATVGEMRALLRPSERMLFYQLDSVGGLALVLGPEDVRIHALAGGPSLADRVADVVARLSRPGGADPAALRELFLALVPPPLWRDVREATTLHVVAHGMLHALPLEALVVGEKDGKPVYWLDEGPPVAYAASGAVLSFLLKCRDAQGGGATSLLALGDPAFSRRDGSWPEQGLLLTDVLPGGQAATLGLRAGDVLLAHGETMLADPSALRGALGRGGTLTVARADETLTVDVAPGPLGVRLAPEPPRLAGPALVERSLRRASGRTGDFPALPGTRLEVEAIRNAFLASGAQATVLLGGGATEGRLFDAAGAGAGYLHLATHGVADETGLASFSFLALALPPVPSPGDDGALTLHDLLTRWEGRLERTGMVVLSACDTQKGASRRHEGIVALPWGFHFAGCPTVVGTLWPVSDATTPELMADFYSRVLARGGAGRLAALLAAKRAIRRAHPDPFCWAAFVLLGDPR